MKIVIVSGYFNPIHLGHIRLFDAASRLGDRLIAVVNNDKQQLLKKGKIIMDQSERIEIVASLRVVDEVILSIDTMDMGQCRTLESIARRWPNDHLIFANGGDRASTKLIPETPVCERCGIEMRFGVGGNKKANSSSSINQRLGHE